MVGLKGRLDKLEQEAEGLYKTLILEDGTQIRYEPEQMLDAVLAAAAGEEHELLPCVRRMNPREGLASLVQALEGPE